MTSVRICGESWARRPPPRREDADISCFPYSTSVKMSRYPDSTSGAIFW